MKQKRKTILKLLIFNIILMLFGCSEDLFDEKINQSQNVIAKKISMQDVQFKSNVKLTESVANLRQLQLNRSSSKYEYNETYDFYIDEENGVFLEKDSLESYTFPVYKTETDSVITNIIFNKNVTGEYDAILAEYDILKSDFTDITAEELAQSEVEYTDITGRFRGPELICIETQEYQYTLEYSPQTGYNYVGHWYTTGSYCFWSDTGGGGGSDISDSSGGGILTGPVDSPHGGGTGSTTVANPCNKIKNQNTKFPSLKQSLVTLATTTSQNYENGTFIDNTATATTVNPVQTIPSNTTNGGTIPLNMNPTNSYVMLAHTHDSYGSDGTGTYSIFSWDDLTTINNLLVNNHIDNSSFVFYVITADGTRYALTVDSPSNLSSFFYNPSNLPFGTQIDTQKLLDMQKVFQKYYDKSKNGLITTTSTAVNDKSNLLKFIKEANLGITLFEVDATFSTYQKLSISNSGVVTPTPCN